ncbi:hypothetical protein VCSRO21_2818 [Vibrio cholerae]|nr:hypothetical protein VCSRO21_2818 [Vibrio cholerae]
MRLGLLESVTQLNSHALHPADAFSFTLSWDYQTLSRMPAVMAIPT